MAVTQTSPSWLAIFGEESSGRTAKHRAETSRVEFVRSQDELGVRNPAASGRVFTAKEALRLFGPSRLEEVWRYGTAILPDSPAEPAKTIRDRREALGLTMHEIAHVAGISEELVAKAESPSVTSAVAHLDQLAMALGLDDSLLGIKPGAGGDTLLAVRLKAWNREVHSPNTVARLSRVSWVVATQSRLQKLLDVTSDPLKEFTQSDDYGEMLNPVWDVAGDLAQETRRILGYSELEPIRPLRDLFHRLQIPLIHSELPAYIAGATLLTGDTRGVVVNTEGNNKNVWVQRATVAHELGHLLWDPAERLQNLRVDNYDQIDRVNDERDDRDYVEARANAFAVELLAPKAAVAKFTGHLDTSNYGAICKAIRENMEHFGLSATAMRYHLWNAYDRSFALDRVPYIDPLPTDDWNGTEQYTDDFFEPRSTPMERRGEFAAVVVRAAMDKWLSEETAAFYLNTSVEEYRATAHQIAGLY